MRCSSLFVATALFKQTLRGLPMLLLVSACQLKAPSEPQPGATAVSASAVGSRVVNLPAAPKPIEGLVEYSDRFQNFAVNPIYKARQKPVSVFAADVDSVAYSYMRKRLNQGYLPQKSALRLEELVNYFDYQYPVPQSADKPFAAQVVVHDSPWAENRQLIHLGIQGYKLTPKQTPAANLVFLLDVSLSMQAADRLPLVQQAMAMLLSKRQVTDTVAIVAYSEAAAIVLPPTKVAQRSKILKALRSLQAQGLSGGVAGIQLAYELAEKHFKPQGINRIFLATDGDFNFGAMDHQQLKALVQRKAAEGIYLSVLGFGQGNYRDVMMQSLAQSGKGTAAYIDTLGEAQRVLIHESRATLFPIAQDLKFQVEFNPETVDEYRLLGYETRLLRREDFNNDNIDAGDIGSGHRVTAIYEVALVDSGGAAMDKLRYGTAAAGEQRQAKNRELAFLSIRYKLPGKSRSKRLTVPVYANAEPASGLLKQEVNFATAVAGFAQLLQGGSYLTNWSYDHAIALALRNRGDDPYGYRNEFVQLVRKAKIAKSIEY